MSKHSSSPHHDIRISDKVLGLSSWGIGCGGGAKTPAEASGGAEYDVPQCAANHGQITTTCNHTGAGLHNMDYPPKR